MHQYCWIGRLARLESRSCVTKDVPPFMVHEGMNRISGVHGDALRRAGISREAIRALHRAYKWLFMRQLSIPSALTRIEAEMGNIPEIAELINFVRMSKRGVSRARAKRADCAPGAGAATQRGTQ